MAQISYDVLVADKATSGSIKNWSNYDKLPPDSILTEAQAWIYRMLRVRHMLTTSTGTLAALAQSIALSSLAELDDVDDFKAPIFFQFTGSDKAELRHEMLQEVHRNISYQADGSVSQGKPQMFYVGADAVTFEIRAKQAYTYEFIYYAALAPLSDANPTNFLTRSAPDLLRYACLRQAFQFMKQAADRDYWEREAMRLIQDINAEQDMNALNQYRTLKPS